MTPQEVIENVTFWVDVDETEVQKNVGAFLATQIIQALAEAGYAVVPIVGGGDQYENN